MSALGGQGTTHERIVGDGKGVKDGWEILTWMKDPTMARSSTSTSSRGNGLRYSLRKSQITSEQLRSDTKKWPPQVSDT